MTDTQPVLKVANVETYYGPIMAIRGVSFEVPKGGIVTILGANGAGKTTVLKTVSGVMDPQKGSVLFEGREVIRASSDRIANLGVAFCPEERGIFASLDVRENLMLPPQVRSGGLSLDQIFELFPNNK